MRQEPLKYCEVHIRSEEHYLIETDIGTSVSDLIESERNPSSAKAVPDDIDNTTAIAAFRLDYGVGEIENAPVEIGLVMGGECAIPLWT